MQAKRTKAGPGRKAMRGHKAVRKSRKGKGKDTRRARNAEQRQQHRAQHAKAIRDAIANVVLDTLSQQQLKQMALVACYTLLSTPDFTRGSAAELSAQIHAVHRETVLYWARSLEAALVLDGPSCDHDDAVMAEALHDCESFWESLRGKHAKVLWLLADSEKQQAAKVWIRKHLKVKGKGNLAVADFALYLNDDLLAEEVQARGRAICDSTARVYLHRLGFDTGPVQKGIDVAVHEREDVVEQRKAYLAALDSEIASSKLPGAKPVVFVLHDEACFMVFDAESSQWFEEGSAPTQKKRANRGKGIMRNEFLTREKGLLHAASLELDFGEDGYFDSPMFLDQVGVLALCGRPLSLP